MRTFHSWILQAHMIRIRDTLAGGLRRFGGHAGGTTREMSREIDRFATGSTEKDHVFGQILVRSETFSSANVARDILPSDPRRLHALWSGLTRTDREALYRADPFIGNRNGIPHVDRHRYNLRNLEKMYDAAHSIPDGHRRALALRQTGTIGFALESPPGTPPRYLTRLEPDFRVAVSIDDPDRADNVVLNAAGAGENPFGIQFASERSEQIRKAALLVDPKAETAVTTWLGYRQSSPGRIDELIPAARRDAPDLRAYHAGLRVTHEGEPSYNTALGYSSGTGNIGYAAREPLDADALVFVGGYSSGAEHVTDLKLVGVDPADMGKHAFATIAEHDSVKLMPELDTAPHSRKFEATLFGSDTVRGPWTSLGWNPDIHGSYFDSNSRSLHNIGLIVTGNGHLVT
ncbi:alpha/beta hydrolase [Nocardia paucivorans]|uniref:alpha/beta hydrolase n=1 Tax=Nocardia paucivorans TaxID=114259 RepID=UPI0002ED69E5|nr:alpha/beta hydrolase [Nocardia paucivorans]